MNYQQHSAYVAHPLVHAVLLLCEVPHVQLYYVRHYVVKHEKTGRLLHLSLVAIVHHVENRRQQLVHTLNILHSRIESGEDEENASHVVVPVAPLQLLSVKAFPVTVFSVYQAVLLAAGTREEGYL